MIALTDLTEKLFDTRRNPSAASSGPVRTGIPNPQNLEVVPRTRQKGAEDVRALKDELDAVRREHGRLQQAIYEAAQIQRRLCSPRELACGDFEIAGEIFPVRHLSGDFFKVVRLKSALLLAVGDIAGKGLTAGIWQAHLMALVQRCALMHSDPAEAVAEVNQELFQSQGEAPLTALFLGRLDLNTSQLAYCNAGLPAPLLLNSTGTLQRLEKGGPMLGAVQRGPFGSGSVQLNPGDLLMAYTDGVTECRNVQEQEFEFKRLSAAVTAAIDASANQALFSTLATVLDFAEGCSPEDDLTLLVVRRRGTVHRAQTTANGKSFSVARRKPASVLRAKKARLAGAASIPNQ